MLFDLVLGYLKSDGFQELEISKDRGYVVVNRPDVGGSYDTRVVWIVPEDEDPSKYTPVLRPLIDRLYSRYPDANGTVLLPSGGGLSRALQQELKGIGIRIRVPIQFFDTSFKVEEAPRAASVIKDIRDANTLRVQQPYQLTDAQGAIVAEGSDLLAELSKRSDPNADSRIQIIVGRAGIGKTVLSRALFRGLYDRFLTAKRQRGVGSRPVPLVPEHMRNIHALRTELLIDNFLRTDVAAPVKRSTFEWLLVHGFTTWLLDGLDELIAGDQGFFDYLLDVVTAPQSSARILLWSRDSLVTTSDAFMEFRELGQGTVDVYRLLEWGPERKRDYAWIQHAKRLPAKGEQDPPRIVEFLERVEEAPLSAFSGVPFYCGVLWSESGHLPVGFGGSEVQVLDHLIRKMLEREIDEKGLIDEAIFIDAGVQQWLEAVATDHVEGNVEVDRETAREYGEMVLRDDVTEEQSEDALLALLRFPFFVQGERMGGISFAHELIAQAVASRAYARDVTKYPVRVAARIMERINLEEPVLLRLMAQQLNSSRDVDPLVRAIHGDGERRGVYRLLLALLMIMRPDTDLIVRHDLPLEDALLARLHFRNLDLRGVSFRRSDLSYTRFERCVLEEGKFEGAFMKGTVFEDVRIRGAEFGDMERVESILWDSVFVDRDEEIEATLLKATKGQKRKREPCPTARQLAHVFGKFITATGTRRRSALRREGIVAGRRFGGAAPENCVRVAIRRQYLAGPDNRGQCRIAQGDKYGEIVRLVRDSRVSEGLGEVISELCPRSGCTHELRVREA